MDLDEAFFEQAFAGELRAETVRDLRAALEARILGLETALHKGQAPLLELGTLDTMREQLAILRQEELIAEFIERGLAASLTRRQILDQLGEEGLLDQA